MFAEYEGNVRIVLGYEKKEKNAEKIK